MVSLFDCELHSIQSTGEITISIHDVKSVKADELLTSHETMTFSSINQVSDLSVR